MVPSESSWVRVDWRKARKRLTGPVLSLEIIQGSVARPRNQDAEDVPPSILLGSREVPCLELILGFHVHEVDVTGCLPVLAWWCLLHMSLDQVLSSRRVR
jgi:hypothetical protein